MRRRGQGRVRKIARLYRPGHALWSSASSAFPPCLAAFSGLSPQPFPANGHWYTRWNVKPFLDRGIISFVQSDPEWCGGISEWLKICELVKAYPGVQVIPHGHHVLGASTCVASQSEALCPMLEYLIKSRIQFQRSQTRPMVAEAGSFAMAEEPGLGPSLDEARMERV